MIEKIKDELYRIGNKVNREQLLELCPVYLLSNHADDRNYLQYMLNELQLDLEQKKIISTNSNVFLCFSLECVSGENQFVLHNGKGDFKYRLEQWLSYINAKYHFEHGLIMLDIERMKDIKQDVLWWKQLFCDIRKYKKNFMIFVSCGISDADTVQKMLENEFFTVRYEMDDFTADEYLQWFTAQLLDYSIIIDDVQKKELKNIFVKYESRISHHILELWLKSLLWQYYGSGNEENFQPASSSVEELLIHIINNNEKRLNTANIGFTTNK